MIVLNEYNKGLIARASHNLTTFVGKVISGSRTELKEAADEHE